MPSPTVGMGIMATIHKAGLAQVDELISRLGEDGVKCTKPVRREVVSGIVFGILLEPNGHTIDAAKLLKDHAATMGIVVRYTIDSASKNQWPEINGAGL